MRVRLLLVAAALALAAGAQAQTFGAWTSAVIDGGDLSVVAPGLHSTAYKMQVVVNDLNPIYVQDDNPSSEARYRARLYFNANSSDPGSASGIFRQRIMTALDTTPSNVRLIEVSFRYNPAVTPNWGVLARVLRPDLGVGQVTLVGPFLIDPNLENYVELDWQHESAPGAADGRFEFWLNGVSQQVVTGIGLNGYGIDTARLGCLTPYGPASAAYFIDEFESRRQTYIGALP